MRLTVPTQAAPVKDAKHEGALVPGTEAEVRADRHLFQIRRFLDRQASDRAGST